MHSIFRCEHGSFLCGSICGKSVVYSAQFNNSEVVKASEWDTTIQDTMEEYENVER